MQQSFAASAHEQPGASSIKLQQNARQVTTHKIDVLCCSEQLTVTLHGTDWLTFQTLADREVTGRGHLAHRQLTVSRIALQFKVYIHVALNP
jgi:hypothetical protein